MRSLWRLVFTIRMWYVSWLESRWREGGQLGTYCRQRRASFVTRRQPENFRRRRAVRGAVTVRTDGDGEGRHVPRRGYYSTPVS